MSQSGITSVAGSNPKVPLEFLTDSGTAEAIANVIEILGGAGSTTSAVGNIITVNVTGSGTSWQTVTSASNPVSLATENGYITGGVAQVDFVLPAAASIGDTYKITGYTSLFQVQQNAGQTIFLGTQSTTIGVLGSLTSLQAQDHIELLCIAANTAFKVVDSIGNLQVV